MTVRALHPIILAGALLALPAVVAWTPARISRPLQAPSAAVLSSQQTASRLPSSVVLPIEIAELGYAPVQKQVEVHLETVPEPSAFLLIASGSLLLLRRKRSN